jgi:hypothetical protein
MNYYIFYKGKMIFDAKNDMILAESKLLKLSTCFTNLEMVTLQLPINNEAAPDAFQSSTVYAFPTLGKHPVRSLG